MITGKEIIVPPHNATLGAIGAALLARGEGCGDGTEHAVPRVRPGAGWNYKLREFTCKGCGNQCSIQEFNVEGEKTFWARQVLGPLSQDGRRPSASPVVADLIALRHELLFADDAGDPPAATKTIGIPLAMYAWDWLPLWRRFFRECGFKVAVSKETNRATVRAGLDAAVAEPCFPIIVAHGHVTELVHSGVDYVWLPNMLTVQERYPDVESYVCPWGSTLPFVVRQSPLLRQWRGRILCPTISLQRGMKVLLAELVRVMQELGGAAARVVKRAFENRASTCSSVSGRSMRKAGREAFGEAARERRAGHGAGRAADTTCTTRA